MNTGISTRNLSENAKAILDNLAREEKQFQKTVTSGLEYLNELLEELKHSNKTILDGAVAFDLYATHGLPLEITRDIAQEQGLDVDTQGFQEAMEAHRLASGAGKEFGDMGGDDVEIYAQLVDELTAADKLGLKGVQYNPYETVKEPVEVLALIHNGQPVTTAGVGDPIEILLPKTGFYVESGGQVSDQGQIVSATDKDWVIQITGMRKPAAGVIVHVGEVIKGRPKVGDSARVIVDMERRKATMRNHTATHLLHAALHEVLGDHARQAGSLVAPDRLRFDFNHPPTRDSRRAPGCGSPGQQKRSLPTIPCLSWKNPCRKPLTKARWPSSVRNTARKYARSLSVKKSPIPTNYAAVPMWMRRVISACS